MGPYNVSDVRVSIQQMAAAIIKRTSLGYGVTAYQETINIAAGQTVEYSISNKLSSSPNVFDYKGTTVIAKVLDTFTGSPTYNMYIDGSAYISSGVDDAGLVKVHNYHDQALTLYVRIDVPHAPNQ